MSDKEIDYSLIREVADADSSFPVQLNSLAADEVTALDQGELEYGQQKLQVELDRLRAELENQRQDTQLRRRFSEQIFQYLRAFSLFCGIIILLQGFGVFGFKLDTPVLVTLEQDAFACAHACCSRSLFDRAIQTCGDSAFGHRALVGGTAASAFGLVSIVLGGLFRNFPKNSNGRKT